MKSIIFDLDNTLIDFVDTKNFIIDEVMKAMIDAGLEESKIKDFKQFYWKHGIENQKILQLYLKKKFGRIDYRALAKAILAYRRAKTGLLRPYPGAKTMLIKLREKGYKLAILSDAPKLECYLRLCSVGFDDFFDVILTKEDIGKEKPNKKGFLKAAKLLKTEPKDCVMVGDRPGKDIEGAKALGMTTILAKYGLTDKKGTKADFEAKSPMDIVKFLER
jgi:putative hydrolase of the HAD superfamily